MSACSQSSIWNQWQTEIIDGPKWPQYGIIHTGMSQNLKKWTDLEWMDRNSIRYTVYCDGPVMGWIFTWPLFYTVRLFGIETFKHGYSCFLTPSSARLSRVSKVVL